MLLALTRSLLIEVLVSAMEYKVLKTSVDGSGSEPWLTEQLPDPRTIEKKGGRAVSQEENERDMRAVVAVSGVRVTEENPGLELFKFEKDDSRYVGEPFSDWSGFYEYYEGLHKLDNYTLAKYDWIEDHLYDGYRIILEAILRDDWEERKVHDFKQIPDTAEWSLQKVGRDVMPILQDQDEMYFLTPTSVECASRLRKLIMPNPYEDLPLEAKPGYYMNYDVWFEDCGDGGAYLLGLDDTVLLFYIDGPGDMISHRWQCSKDQWESMWLKAFGSTTIELDGKMDE